MRKGKRPNLVLNILLIFLIQILLFYPTQVLAQNISIVTVDSSTTTAGTQHTLSNFQVTAGDNRLLVVGVTLTGTVLPDINSVTFGDQTFTLQVTDVRGLIRTSIFTLVDPDIETNNIVINTDLQAATTIGAMYLRGVDTNNPVPLTNSANGFSSVPSVSITTTFDNMLILDTLATLPVVTASADGSQTVQWNLELLPSTLTGAGSTKLVSTTSSTSMDWNLEISSIPTSESWALAAIAIKEQLLVSPTDTASISDSVSTTVHRVVSPTDTASISDSVSTTVHRVVSPTDTASISDSVSTTVHRVVSLTESVGIIDSANALKNLIQVSLNDSVSISDNSSFAHQSQNPPPQNNEKSNNNKSGSGRTGVNTQSFDDEHLCKYSSSKNSNDCSIIPNFMKHVIDWWLDEHISDVELANAFRFLIDNDIIVIEKSTLSQKSLKEIPENVKLIAKLWAENKLSDSNFQKIISDFFGN